MPTSDHDDSIAREAYQKTARGETLLTDLGTPLHYSALSAPYACLICYIVSLDRGPPSVGLGISYEELERIERVSALPQKYPGWMFERSAWGGERVRVTPT